MFDMSSVWSSSSVNILYLFEMAVARGGLMLVMVGLMVLLGCWNGGSVERIGKSAPQAGPFPGGM